MVDLIKIRSVSFDTSFLLKDKKSIDDIIKILSKDNINCFITSTVVSELEQLKIWSRITDYEYHKAIKRWKKVNATIIDFKNRFLSDVFGKKCLKSMKKHHGVQPEDIVNDCSILVIALKKGVDIFLSEDFHFTSKFTKKVINEITHEACVEYHQMCNKSFYGIDSITFLESYSKNKLIDNDIIKANMKNIRKSGKSIF
jgi:rRNA-processing protein FCF1